MKSIYGSYYPVSVPYMIQEIQALKQERKQIVDLLENFCNNLTSSQSLEKTVELYLNDVKFIFEKAK
jgi:hypothetical protein